MGLSSTLAFVPEGCHALGRWTRRHSRLTAAPPCQAWPYTLTVRRSCCTQSVGRENLEEFMAYGFYNQRWEALSRGTQQQIREFMTRVEAAWGIQFPEGRNPNATFMRHLWEPLRSVE